MYTGITRLLGKGCVLSALAEGMEEACVRPFAALLQQAFFPDGFSGARHLLNLTGMW